MSKELEAFYYLMNIYGLRANGYEKYQLVENALKEYELIKNTRFIVADKKISDEDLEKLKNQRIFANGLEECKVEPLFDEETQKKLKALEIIKDKRVDVSWLHKCFNFIENCSIEDELDYYNNNYEAYRNSKPLTLEEHKLLREVLL